MALHIQTKQNLFLMSMLMKTLTNVFLVAITVFIFSACGKSRCDPAPDVSEMDISIQIERFDQDLFNLDTTNIEAGLEELYKKYPEFADFYFQILGFKGEGAPDSAFHEILSGYINHPFSKQVYDTTQIVYGDVSDIELELSESFKYLQHYLPSQKVPRILSMYSEFTDYMIIPPFENMYVVSLEYFFGPDYEIYYALPQQPVPYYVARTQNRDHLPAKILNGIITKHIIPDSTMVTHSLLDNMILNGKRLYLLDKILPCTPDSVKFGYSKGQTKFVKDNEFQMWKEVFAGKLYDTDYKSFQKYIGPSPNSPDMPAGAPGNTGSYVGFKIIESFMERNPNYSMEQLIKIEDSKEILIKSRYKPKK